MDKIDKILIIFILVGALYNVICVYWYNVSDEFKAIYALVVLVFVMRNIDINIVIKRRDKDSK